MENDLLLRALRREPVPRPPVWLMRQAGRYLPQYRALRERVDFMTLLRTPELAVEVTLQPVEAVGVDAAIIFCDILVIPDAMGMALSVEEGTGPRLENPIRSPGDLSRLLPFQPEASLGAELAAVRMAAEALGGQLPLIGFAGGPWTLASYMIEGGGTRDFRRVKRFLAEQPAAAHRLLGLLAKAAGDWLVAQAEAGANVVQLFESWGGVLGPRDFSSFVLPYLARAVAAPAARGVPVIVFAPGAGWALEAIAETTGAAALGIDSVTAPENARRRLAPYAVTLQGNLDPGWLYAPPATVRERTREMVAAFGPRAYIANLGHGVFRDTPVGHVRAFVEAVREGVGYE